MTLPERPRAVVTGAGSGLGRAFCLELAARGGQILAVDIDLARAEETAALCKGEGGEVVAGHCDVSKEASVRELSGKMDRAFGGTDLLINNAGVSVSGPVGSVPLADWEWIVGVNLWGTIYGCQTFVPTFRALGRGHVINVASAAGLLSAPDLAPYNVTKAGVVALSETLHAELRGTGVGVTVLCPTFFRTNIARDGRATGEDNAEAAAELMARASVQAPDVARRALEAAAAGTLYALPHADGRWMWRLKRLMPELFQGKIVPQLIGVARRRRARAHPPAV